MRWGLTTGTCAALAAKAAARLLLEQEEVDQIDVPLPDGSRVAFRVQALDCDGLSASATVVKDAGDDPDVTHGSPVIVRVRRNGGDAIHFFAGAGVGTVTRAGLAVPPGEPAINPGPRRMIAAALREVSAAGFDVTISVPAGAELARKTFNPRLGIVGGISILGTSGRVRPFSAPALRTALVCALDVAVAAGVRTLVLVPGNLGNRAAQRHFGVAPGQIVDVSNEWGFMLAEAAKHDFSRLLLLGHPGKLGKLAQEQWQTHSSQAGSAVPFIAALAAPLSGPELGRCATVEELFMQALDPGKRRQLADLLGARIAAAVSRTCPALPPLAVALINLQGEILGGAGDLDHWRAT